MTSRAGATVAPVALIILAGALLAAAETRARPQATADRISFAGTWSAAGNREALAIAGGRIASSARVSGALVLTGGTALGRGFQAEAIGFDNGAGLTAGCAVWTDSRGDRIFSDFTGDLLHSGRRITGTITGGTGRFAGATGGYELTWRYALAGDDAGVHGRATDLRGWIRLGEAS
jgi:hypothetical protein